MTCNAGQEKPLGPGQLLRLQSVPDPAQDSDGLVRIAGGLSDPALPRRCLGPGVGGSAGSL